MPQPPAVLNPRRHQCTEFFPVFRAVHSQSRVRTGKLGKDLPCRPYGLCLVVERFLEGKRMASGHTGNVVPRKGLRVRVSCPPLA